MVYKMPRHISINYSYAKHNQKNALYTLILMCTQTYKKRSSSFFFLLPLPFTSSCCLEMKSYVVSSHSSKPNKINFNISIPPIFFPPTLNVFFCAFFAIDVFFIFVCKRTYGLSVRLLISRKFLYRHQKKINKNTNTC